MIAYVFMCVHVWMWACVHVCMCVQMYECMCLCVCVSSCLYMCVLVGVYEKGFRAKHAGHGAKHAGSLGGTSHQGVHRVGRDRENNT